MVHLGFVLDRGRLDCHGLCPFSTKVSLAKPIIIAGELVDTAFLIQGICSPQEKQMAEKCNIPEYRFSEETVFRTQTTSREN